MGQRTLRRRSGRVRPAGVTLLQGPPDPGKSHRFRVQVPPSLLSAVSCRTAGPRICAVVFARTADGAAWMAPVAAAVTASAAVQGKLSAASRAALRSPAAWAAAVSAVSRSCAAAVRYSPRGMPPGKEAAEALPRSSARVRSAPHATRSWLSARASRAMTSPGSVVVAPRVVTSSSGLSAYPCSARARACSSRTIC